MRAGSSASTERNKGAHQRGTEPRVRVTFFVPAGTQEETNAVDDLIRYLKGQRRSALPITGFTHSPIDTTFEGLWWSKESGDWIADMVVFFTIDYLAGDRRRLGRALSTLRAAIGKIYADRGSPQEEVWIISQRVSRH